MAVAQAQIKTQHEHLVGSVTSAEKQAGNTLTSAAFMARLRKINPDLIMVPHPNQNQAEWLKNTGLLYLTLPDQTLEYLMPCEWDRMPEWSVMSQSTARKPDWKAGGLWKTVPVVGRETKRGWRTILIRLIKKRLITLGATEKEFGIPSDRQSWYVLTGKGSGVVEI